MSDPSPNPLKRLVTEVRRRSLVRVLGIYLLGGWVAFEVVQTLTEGLRLPEWFPAFALVLLIIGLPVVLATAFVQEGGPVRGASSGDVVGPPGGLSSHDLGVGSGSGGVRRLFTWRNAVAGGVVAFALGVVATGWLLLGPGGDEPSPSSEVRSLAVLPLANLMGNPDQAYFVDGMHDALIGELANLTGLTVLSRTSTLRYRETDLTASEIAAELGVAGLVEGSVFRSGDSVRVTVQLIRGDPEGHLWSGSYDGEVGQALVLQRRVARAVAEEVGLVLSPSEEARLAEERAVDPRAQDAYLRGRALWRTRSLEGLDRSVELFEEAVALDPDFATGHAGLAAGHLMRTHYYAAFDSLTAREAEDGYARARAAARRALELDPDLAEAHATLGYVRFMETEWDEAEEALRHALELSPNDAQTWDWLADLVRARGRFGEAIQAMERARELDPFSPLMNRDLGAALLFGDRCPEAEPHLRTALEMDPRHLPAYWILADCAIQDGRLAEAVEHNTAYLRAEGQPEAADELQRAWESGGWEAANRYIAGSEAFSDFQRAVALSRLSREDEAVDLLWGMWERGNPSPIFFAGIHPAFTTLRRHPGYEGLLEEIGLGGG